MIGCGVNGSVKTKERGDMTHLIHFCEKVVNETVSRLVEWIDLFVIEGELNGKVEKAHVFVVLNEIILQCFFIPLRKGESIFFLNYL